MRNLYIRIIKNLINIYSSLSSLSPQEIVKKYEGVGYGVFKEELAQVVVDGLRPIRNKYEEYRKDKDYLERVYRDGDERASYLAEKTVRKVFKKMGFIPK